MSSEIYSTSSSRWTPSHLLDAILTTVMPSAGTSTDPEKAVVLVAQEVPAVNA